MTKPNLRFLSGNTLKILACIAMVIDHVGVLFFPSNMLYRKIGRLALPLFAFLLAEGCKYTRNKKKHFFLLAFFAGVCQCVYDVFAYLNGDSVYVFCRFWLPSERIEDATALDGVPYNLYIQRGLLWPSGANIVEYTDVFNWFKELVEQYEIFPLKVGYDRYSANYLVQQMDGYGFHMDDVYQGFNLHPVIQEVEGLLKDGKIHIGDNDLLKIHLFNSALKISTEKGRSKLVKIRPSAHIDGMAALLDAMTVRQKWYADIGRQLENNTED